MDCQSISYMCKLYARQKEQFVRGELNSKIKMEAFENLSSIFLMVDEYLDEQEKELLLYEFVLNTPKWWIGLYSPSTFYRLKKRTINDFNIVLNSK
ncbi:MAG: hypothetical protein WBO70_03265 [Erysipelotrichaceae bacterium]